jgi:hypothetical protein
MSKKSGEETKDYREKFFEKIKIKELTKEEIKASRLNAYKSFM